MPVSPANPVICTDAGVGVEHEGLRQGWLAETGLSAKRRD